VDTLVCKGFATDSLANLVMASNFVPSSLSDLSKNRDFLEYYVLRLPGKIVKLRSDRYYF